MVHAIRNALSLLGVHSSVAHADLPTEMRISELSDFLTNPDRTLLIATNGYARGIRVPTLCVVFQFDLPLQSTTYYHRATRTIESGNLKKMYSTFFGTIMAVEYWRFILTLFFPFFSGISLALITKDELMLLQKISNRLRIKITDPLDVEPKYYLTK